MRPTRLLKLQMRFPANFGPLGTPRIRAYNVDGTGSPQTENEAESARAKPQLVFEPDLGYVFFDLDWVLPSFLYEIEWPLRQEPLDTGLDAIRAKEQARSLIKLNGIKFDRLIEGLAALRDRVAGGPLGLSECQRSLVDLSLWVFDPDKQVARMAAGTYPRESPYWATELPWGVSAQGWVMRRHRPLFLVTSEHDAEGVYRPLQDSSPELHLLCVPVPLPWPASTEEVLERRLAPCAVLTLACSRVEGNMERLTNQAVGGQVSSDLLEGMLGRGPDLDVATVAGSPEPLFATIDLMTA